MSMCETKGDIAPMNPNLRILLVDDDIDIRICISNLLHGGMHFSTVATAENGLDALEHLERGFDAEKPFHIVISDYDMPKMNGAELLKKIKADERFKSIQVILMSGAYTLEDIPAENRGDVVEFFRKPPGDAVLESALQKAAHEILMASR